MMRKNTINNKDILSTVLLTGVFLFVAISVTAANEVPVPTINISPDVYYPSDEILYLEGRAKPTSNIEVQFQKQGAKPLKFNVKSDTNGEWVLAEKVPLRAGDWEVRVRSTASEWSNPRVFKVVITGITIGGVNIKFAFLSFVIIFLMLAGAAVVSYFILRIRRLKSDLVSKEIHEAHESVREGMSHIRKDLLEELKSVESSEKPLSLEQVSKKEHLVSAIDRLEKEMDHEISDIEHRSRGEQ